MSHFDNLMAIVTANNDTYARITHDLHLFEDLDDTNEAKRQATKRNHFAHEYANTLDNYVIRHYDLYNIPKSDKKQATRIENTKE